MRHLVTSALPYINGIKHLGNLAGSLLPADIHARYLRQAGEEVAFICATDEHGTPAELGAATLGLNVQTYCDLLHVAQAEIYRQFDLSFDHFGRTSSAQNARFTQDLFLSLDENGFIEEKEIQQIWSPADARFLPDRYVEGTCPHCGGSARGDQCDVCSATLDPIDLLNPRSAISGAEGLELRSARHLFLRQSTLQGKIQEWIDSRHDWPPQVLAIAKGWLAQGLQDRCITRDLSWGIPVPKKGYEHLRFYVWFDAPIGYISATKEWADLHGENFHDWWDATSDVRHVQFLGKDNVPFHALSFPATLIGSGKNYHTADLIKGVNWLSYEGGKFSTSQKRGIFLDQALKLLPSDYWRWWLAANSPENSDVDFSFERFAQGVNADLADNFGNLVSRVFGFVASRYKGSIPQDGEDGLPEIQLLETLDRLTSELWSSHQHVEIRRSADRVREIWNIANAYVANQKPWSLFNSDPERASVVTRKALGLVRLSALVAEPFIPSSTRKVLSLLGTRTNPCFNGIEDALQIPADIIVERHDPIFAKISQDWIETQRHTFSG